MIKLSKPNQTKPKQTQNTKVSITWILYFGLLRHKTFFSERYHSYNVLDVLHQCKDAMLAWSELTTCLRVNLDFGRTLLITALYGTLKSSIRQTLTL